MEEIYQSDTQIIDQLIIMATPHTKCLRRDSFQNPFTDRLVQNPEWRNKVLTSSLSQLRWLSVCRSFLVMVRRKPSLRTSSWLPPLRALLTSFSMSCEHHKQETPFKNNIKHILIKEHFVYLRTWPITNIKELWTCSNVLLNYLWVTLILFMGNIYINNNNNKTFQGVLKVNILS